MSDKYKWAEDKKNYINAQSCVVCYVQTIINHKHAKDASFKEIVTFIHQSWLRYVLWVQL